MYNIKALAIAVFAATAAASQAVVIFEFSQILTGPGTPILPAGRVTIANSGPNKVDVTIANLVDPLLHPTSTQFIGQVALNVSPFPASGRSSSFSSPVTGVAWSEDKTNTGYKFDVEIDLTSAGGSRLKPGQSTTLSLMGAGLTESHFLATSPGTTDLYGLMHVLSTSNGNSIKLKPVPEPATMLGLAMGASVLIRRRRSR